MRSPVSTSFGSSLITAVRLEDLVSCQFNNNFSKKYMKFNISLKDQQREFLEQVVSDFSLGEIEISIQNLVKEILNQDDNENVFGEMRCIGGCFSTDESIEVELEDELISKMREIFQQYDFEEYDSEEEELSKIVRSMINFAEQEGDLKNIFVRA
ncbi:hypothetical protein OAI91_00420 [bacterium]|nr:hypothetical protein [bacterium]